MAPLTRLRELSARLLADVDRVDVCLQVTLLTVIVYHHRVRFASGPVIALCAAGLIFGYCRRHWLPWAGVTVLMAAILWEDRHLVDNHQYLFAYTTLAITLALWSGRSNPGAVLRPAAALLLGSVMLLATIQKVMSPDFRSGAFFEYMLLAGEPRFQSAANLLGGVPSRDLEFNREDQQRVLTGRASSARLRTGPRIPLLVNSLSALTILVEGALAVTFLAPTSRHLYAARSALLLLFIAGTYAVAPVIGFGWNLVALGIASAREDDPVLPAVLLVLMLILPVFTIPWSALLTRLGVGW